jgi:hypothetical protein
MLLGLKRISTALGLLAASAAASQAQTPAPSFNQATANAVAENLRASRALAGYRIEIETRSGLVTLTGSVGSQAQKHEALRRARQVAGVSGVIDGLSVSGDNRVRAAQYEPQVALGHHRRNAGNVIYDGAGAGAGAPIGDGSVYDGPLPEGPAGMPGATQAVNPRMPNYAWPSYAPYPNFSAVGYPTAYPWQAWPNIAPPYPYPEVPLDWRAVTLRWDDGIWWLDFKKNYTRPFFTPYPFGIFAY